MKKKYKDVIFNKGFCSARFSHMFLKSCCWRSPRFIMYIVMWFLSHQIMMW